MKPLRGAALVLALCLVGAGLSACRIEKRAEAAANAASTPAAKFTDAAFDPEAQVRTMWASQVLPSLQARATEFGALRQALDKEPEATGQKLGHRRPAEGAPWNFAVQVKGRVLAVDSSTSAGTATVDTDGDGRADLQLQIGPVLRGTALRDSLPFIAFTAYANQVQFAQLANAFNAQAYAQALQALPREALAGRQLEMLAVFTADDNAELPLLTPVQLRLEPK